MDCLYNGPATNVGTFHHTLQMTLLSARLQQYMSPALANHSSTSNLQTTFFRPSTTDGVGSQSRHSYDMLRLPTNHRVVTANKRHGIMSTLLSSGYTAQSFHSAALQQCTFNQQQQQYSSALCYGKLAATSLAALKAVASTQSGNRFSI